MKDGVLNTVCCGLTVAEVDQLYEDIVQLVEVERVLRKPNNAPWMIVQDKQAHICPRCATSPPVAMRLLAHTEI